MTNSLLEQLQRDAQKSGAHQAKVAYATYLINKADLKEITQVPGLLAQLNVPEQTHKMFVPDEYQAQAWLQMARYLKLTAEANDDAYRNKLITCYKNVIRFCKKNTLEFTQARRALIALYECRDAVQYNYYVKLADNYPVFASRVTKTPLRTAEFEYKSLRHDFNQSEKSRSEYTAKLKLLLEHPELTDTLKAKIYYQLLRMQLLAANESGSINDFDKALQLCRKLISESKLNAMKKVDNARAVLIEIEKSLQAIHSEDAVILNRRPYTSASRNIFVRAFNYLRNSLYLSLNQHALRKQAENAMRDNVKKLSKGVFDFSASPASISVQISKEEKASRKAIHDLHSTTSAKVVIPHPVIGADTKLPYLRLTTTKMMQIFVKSLEGKMFTIEALPHHTVEEIKGKILKADGTPVEMQRLIFCGRQLEDGRTLEDYNLGSETTLLLSKRLNGD